MKKLFALLALAAVLTCAAAGFAAYPEKPVKVIVPSEAGGGTDTMARLIAKFGEKYLGAPMVIENKPGAGGQIGFQAIANAKKDGYTFGCLYTPHLTAHVSAKRAKYTLASFDMIANVVTDPGAIVVPKDSPLKTLADLQAFAKANRATASTSGPGGDDDFARIKTEQALGISLKPVPSKGSSGQKTNVLGGHVTVGFMNVSQVEAQLRSGELRCLAVMAPKRSDMTPEVPCTAELGYGTMVSDSSRGFAAPAGMNAEALAKIKDMFAKVMADPEFLEAAKGQLLLNMMDAAEYKEYLESLQAATDKAYEVAPW
ncbi:MAG: tripartite tricarboxylate transporter substrate binding protein [Pyramidobacter sp.]|nr:tripartite tricarboxylate transporter substrate binding protein [Pyramidobacter sp.]